MQTPAPVETSEPAEGEAYPYPLPQQQLYIPPTPRSYPEPQGGSANPFASTPFVVPDPGADTGVVTGQLLAVENGEPMAFQTVYLGMKIPLTPGPGFTYGLQEISSPHTVTTEDGMFAMGEVPPGSYLVMVFTPHSVSVVMQPDTDQELEVLVSAGETIDLGALEAVTPQY